MALTRTERPRGLAAAAASDPGRERGNNEDRVLAVPELGIFAVIDGVGGESAGEVAADIALEVLEARLSRRTTDLSRLVREAIALANRQIYERAKGDPRLSGMACVLTVAVLEGHRATVGHVGDSRLYVLKAGEIRKATPDHSPVGLREDAGEISEEEAMRHPRRNEIFRDVGSGPHEPDERDWIDVLEVPFPAEAALLLCSDGLSDMISSREILETVEASVVSLPPGDASGAANLADVAVHALLDRANRAGGRDNVSTVLVLGDRFVETVRRKSGGSGRRSEATTVTAAGMASDRTPDRKDRREKAPGRRSARSPRTSDEILDRTLDQPLLRGAARVRPGVGERLGDLLTGTAAKIVLVLALLALLGGVAWFFRAPIEDALGMGGGASPGKPRDVLVVGIGDGGFGSISEALAQARPGQRIEVAPGQYHERLALKDGVAVVSRTPGGAVLLPPLDPTEIPAMRAIPAVTASGIHGARLAGLKVLGSATASWSLGVRLDGSEVELDGVEVSGATGPGIEIRGADRSTVRYSYIHANGGPGILIAGGSGGDAAPRLLGNLIAGNGTRPGALAPGVEVRGTAVPLLTENRIEGNGGGGVTLSGPERADEIFRWNNFGAVPKEQAVRSVASTAPVGAASPAGAGTAGAPTAPGPSAASGESGGSGVSGGGSPARPSARRSPAPASRSRS